MSAGSRVRGLIYRLVVVWFPYQSVQLDIVKICLGAAGSCRAGVGTARARRDVTGRSHRGAGGRGRGSRAP